MQEMAFPGFCMSKFSGGGCPLTPLLGVRLVYAPLNKNARSAPGVYTHSNAAAISRELGVSVKTLKQLIMHLTFEYNFLKQLGSVFFFTCPLLGHAVSTPNSFAIRLSHVIKMLETKAVVTFDRNAKSCPHNPS